MKKRTYGSIICIFVPCFTGYGAARSAGASSRPNIIVLLADDAGIGDDQPYHRFFDIKPEDRLQTPNIQKLEDEGDAL